MVLMLIGWIYIIVRGIYEWYKGISEDARSEAWSRSRGYKGYYDHNNKWIEFK